MTAAVRTSTEAGGAVAVIEFEAPPVNGLGARLRAGIAEALQHANADDRVAVIVLWGSGGHFSAGADVTEFNTPAATAEPMLRDLIATLQNGKPVVAAIDGYAMGGGLELALGCRWRIATRDAQLGLTETRLGIIPGAGGTQLLPRVIGMDHALDMIVAGRTVTGERAREIGLVEQAVDSDVRTAGIAFAELLDSADRDGSAGLSTDPVPIGTVDFDARRTRVSRRARNRTAQLAAIDALEAAGRLDLPDGLDHERAIFQRLVASTEAKSVRHLFFAERAAARGPQDLQPTGGRATPTPIRTVGVVGSGTMGSGIAMAFADHGVHTVVVDQSAEALGRAQETIRRNYEISAAKGRLDAAEVERRLACIHTGTSYDDLSGAELVVEAVFEDLDVKKAVFAELERVCSAGAVLATNTSRLNVDEIAASTGDPSRVVGLHFFSPANVMRLLEVVRGEKTSTATLATALGVAARIGKTPVTTRVCEGFVGNRMLTPYWTETWFLVEEGATPAQVDAAMRSFGMAMGPFAMADLAGLDINWAARKRLAPTRPADQRYSRLADLVCEAGRFGQKTGAGWYRYEPGDRTPHHDPAVDEIIARCRREAGIEPRTITDQEIVERCALALVNEGAKILQDRIVDRSGDIDVVYVNGYGFPAATGGPMFWAENEGLVSVLSRIERLRERSGPHWSPAPLLADLVRDGAPTFDARAHVATA